MTNDELLTSIKNYAALPVFQNTWTDQTILQAASEELRAWLAPVLAAAQEEYFVDFEDKAIVASQSAYDFPWRAMGGVVRKLCYVDAAGIEYRPLKRISLDETSEYQSGGASTPLAFYFTADAINIVPTPGASPTGSLRVYYMRRPSDLVCNLDAAGATTGGPTALRDVAGFVGVVASVATNVITLSGLGSAAGFSLGNKIDLVSATPPHKTLAKDLLVTASSGVLVTVSGAVTGYGIAAGDYLTLAGKTYVPQLPPDFHSVLALRTAAHILSALGDDQGAASKGGQAEELRRRLLDVAEPRSKGNTEKFTAWGR